MLSPKKIDTWADEMSRIVVMAVDELISAANKHNVDRDSAIKYFADLFSAMADIATFEHFERGNEDA